MYRKLKKSIALTCISALLAGVLLWSPVAHADLVAQTLPFSQNWTTTGLITVNHDWSGVPGIIGYRGDALTGGTGTDPQTILADGSTTPVDVNANQTNPNTFATGGVAEFHIADPVVALNGSGTADAPHIVINLNTNGMTAVNVAYNVRDIDGSADDAIQQVALQYRVGNSGNYTNLSSGYVPDATTGGAATLVTPVNVTLPAAAEGQSLVQVRVMTTNAVGNDEWVGIDDINVTGVPIGGPTNPSGVGAANPSTVAAGANTLLTVTVTNGTNPTSTGVTVNGDLTAIGGSPTQQFFDNGTNGDVIGGDNIFSFAATVGAATTAGPKILPTTINDAQGRTANANINLTVTSSSTAPSGTGAANPSTVTAGNPTLLTVAVVGGANPPSTGLTVSGDLTTIGGSASQAFFDNGTNGDTTPGDNTFSFSATVAAGTSAGPKSLPVIIADAEGRSGNTNISLTVNAAPPTGQLLPFSQSWTDTSQITTNNVWTGVPGIVGYLGDFSAGSETGVDPQTLLTDFSGTTVSVVANQPDPNPLISGGVAEFELADPVVGFQGSGTADAPHIVISVNTTGASNVTVSYLLRDVDSSSDNSVQPVALQYRIGASGNYTNVPAAFVADASDGPSTATRVTPVGVVLPAAASNQPLVQLRIMTTNALNSDEWIGVDNITVESNGTIPLSGVGAALPNNVEAGAQTRLVVTVNPATNPTSSGVTVVGNLTSIGGSATQPFFDNGTNGDVTPGDNVFSFLATVPANTPTGSKVLPVTINDAQARTANTSIGLIVSATGDPQIHLTMGNPSGATTNVNTPTNYLLARSQYVMSYNRDRGIPNWVSWHLDSSWLGDTPRQDDFRADTSLPAGWYQVQHTDYSGSGFDRGHHTPSADRTRSVPDNSSTFLMTNMMPQAPFNNQGPWEELESYCRTLVSQGNELYIIMGGAGQGGSGSNGGTTNTVANGNVVVPSVTWKVIIVLPVGANDTDRVFKTTRTIAVIMPNRQDIGINTPWRNFRTNIDQVERLTGFNLLSNVRPQIQNIIERRVDTQ